VLTIQAQESNLVSDELKDNIQLRIDNGINVGIMVGILENGEPHYYSFGYKSLKTREPLDEHSVFEIGSISKTFTGTILADLVTKDQVKLEDPLQNYLPDGITAPSRNGASIQLVHMANHTSSLPRLPNNFSPKNPANPYADYTEKQLYDFLNSYELSRDIGSQYEYSNYAMGLLGHILASTQDMTYEELMIRTIAEPLDMKNTRITFTPEMKNNLAIGHSAGREVENWDIPTLAGAGAIRSTAVDMLKYLAANQGFQKSDLYPAMKLAHKNSRIEGNSPIVGLAWHTMVFNDLEIVWHNGGTGGYRTFAGFVKDGNRAVVVLSNTDASVDDIGTHLLNPSSPLQNVKPAIGVKIKNIIDTEGIEAGVKSYWDLKNNQAEEFEFGESQLNDLGYEYLRQDEIDKAIAVFKINIEAYPDASNVFDSMGEAFMKNGERDKAIEHYKKSIELNPGNQNGIDKLKELGVNTADLIEAFEVSKDILEQYVGQYELVPGFILTISLENNQLKAQATGQPEFPVFAKSENVFYYKVVEAELTFNQNDGGIVESVTLFQGGQKITGKKLEK
jgi:CubicO group peptidase (beta-lactamase class C family)